ncbi:MAG: transcription termination factor NusA [Candidatus Lloydbacteria bacterium RIFCSPLOWO2_01_FULL_50_20]|uniref:Transcription termination/antitermination protein NusA n=1 Tax=Candidatus Lloydbacteria bacterium RIFCSPLOWO2_01_FULL_50_20 TaxID=1798665 RepID=A0A1G2DLT6_9BACT|nr:MAG: transcription termination factor NusA [Candidatus Lloydbacteria bacterium RIFCSPHIGHO2_02_FULL_50_11]OGZ13778.1 MAG: transcription termination factor NusA [Candidatus Lloydbacteria bacterium RIFCSPLOWO2_01_FULL_50_20]
MRSALEQLEEERGISKDKIIDAIESALAAAYKKDYGKKGQIVRAKLDMDTGKTDFVQVKVVVDDSLVRMPLEGEEEEEAEWRSYGREKEPELLPLTPLEEGSEIDTRVRFNPEHHIMLEDARLIKKDAVLNEELIFPLDAKDDYGRIAAQTAKQVIIQKIREAEKSSVLDEFAQRGEEIVTGVVQRIERGNIFIDLGRATGLLAYEDQIPGERYRTAERIRSYLYSVEESPRGINLRLSRAHPNFVRALFALEAPEVASGVVELKEIAREAGSRTKIAVHSNDSHVDPVGSCVGQRGVRVTTVISELGGEKIDVIEWSPDIEKFIADALSPAKVRSVIVNAEERHATVEVMPDQLSLAIGRGGQNVRLAAKLTGFRIDIKSTAGEEYLAEPDEPLAKETAESPEEEVKEFIESESTGEPSERVTPEEEAAEDKEVVAENTNTEKE